MEISTSGHRDMHDRAEPVTAVVRNSGIRYVHNGESTEAGEAIGLEPSLQQNLLEKLDEVAALSYVVVDS